MRIAIPLSENQLAEEFSRSGEFAIFDLHDETRSVGYVGRQSLSDPGCGRTPAFLRQHGVEVILGHSVSQNAVNHLLEVGIVAIKDAPILPADALIAHLVSGTLRATPPEVAMHGGGCGSGGCGHCAGGHAAEEAAHEHGHGCGDNCGTHGCGDVDQSSSGCCH
jgi:predicted Fe-Mo cluster-binding NifX family protein